MLLCLIGMVVRAKIKREVFSKTVCSVKDCEGSIDKAYRLIRSVTVPGM